MDVTKITIQTAELIAGTKQGVLETGSIGSCVVIALYDSVNEVGGIAHAMLPKMQAGAEALDPSPQPAKYADQAIENLIQAIEEKGGEKQNLIAKLVGGASMFKSLSAGGHSIGNQNIEAAREKLRDLAIPIKNEDTGGNTGKLVRLHLSSGIVEVYTKL